jgi:hypothetical protein
MNFLDRLTVINFSKLVGSVLTGIPQKVPDKAQKNPRNP